MNSAPNHLLKHKSFQVSAKPPVESPEEITQYIVFKLADYSLALPSQEILKIVAMPSQAEGGFVNVGLVQLGQYSIQIVDLAGLFGLPRPTPDANNPPSFLIVFQTAAKELWGIAVQEPPDLMSVPSYALKPIPPQKRLTRALRWISHIVTYDLNSDRHTLLLLDLSIFFSRQQTQADKKITATPAVPRPIEPTVKASDLIATSGTLRKSEMYV